MIDGTLYKISAWIKDGAKGQFMSLSFELPRSAASVRTTLLNRTTREVLDDEIPF